MRSNKLKDIIKRAEKIIADSLKYTCKCGKVGLFGPVGLCPDCTTEKLNIGDN